MPGALSHLRVLDLSRVLAGPWAGQMLADLGAEVIKIEKPGDGDDTRAWGPPFLKDRDGAETRESAYYLSANRAKKSVAVDFTSPEGAEIIRRLAEHCDVVLENFKVRGLKKYGLDYESLRKVKPDIVYCSITGFGQTGPYAQRPGYDFLVQGMGGLMSLTGDPDGEPMKVGVAVIDIFTGLHATIGILAALAYRDRTGEGQHIDLGLLDTQVAVLANQAANYLVGDIVPGRLGNAHPNIVPYQALAAQDGHVILAIGNDSQFSRFCAEAGCPELAADDKFKTNADRVRNRDTLLPLLKQVMASRKSADWLERLEAAGIPCGPINDLAQVFEDPQVRHRGMAVNLPHPVAGEVRLVANPIRLSATPVVYDRPPPTLGADTDDVLQTLLRISAQELHQLRSAGAIQQLENA
jgi:crotonobetainyl-CoA:carnitine CoA-transferase CaiB-like acyl-CoA transferase